jgi:hypothetical protein
VTLVTPIMVPLGNWCHTDSLVCLFKRQTAATGEMIEYGYED